ncbi:host specificity protein J, partial [Pseudodesulfovibrio sp. JC047]|uniref:host specificity protein J n=1 Tax=Pseudodesulfovibrio sp. JC047 TaxID=2683199 RepID=UPI0013D6BB51
MKRLEITGSGGGGGGGGGGHTPIEAANDLRSKATTRGLGVLSEGEIFGLVAGAKSIYFDNTPLEDENGILNFEGVTWWERKGTPDQEYIPGFPAIESETNVNAQVVHDTPVTRTIVNPDVDAVRVRVQLPQGLMQQEEDGDLVKYSVDIAFDVRASGGDWIERVSDTITGKTMSPYERAYRIDLTGSAPWDIRMRRVSEDTESSKIRDEVSFSAFTAIIDAKLIYPDTAVMGLAIDAEKFGNAIPSVSFDIKGIKVQVPSNYDPETREFAGLWDGTFKLAWTDNPAWCVYDMMRNDRYGLGLTAVDKWAMYEIAQYCDELVPDGFGGMEPRFRLNCVLQTREDAYHVVNTLISVCRGLCFWGSGTVTFSQDKPDTPTHVVAPANVENGDFQYQGTGLSARHTAVLVTWNDPEDGYKPTVEVVEHAEGMARYGWNPTDVVAFGCTSRGQAYRVGKWILDTEQSETETVSFVAGLDFADAQPGNLIEVADPAVAGVRMGGRLKSASVSQVVLDAPIIIDEGEGYVLTVVLPDKTVFDARVVNAPGETDTLDLSEPLPQIPKSGAMWVVSATNVEPRVFRVLSNREADLHKYEISAIERDDTKFARVEQNIKFDPKPTSLIPSGPIPKPTAPAIDEYL